MKSTDKFEHLFMKYDWSKKKKKILHLNAQKSTWGFTVTL